MSTALSEVDWDSLEDPNNPHNWLFALKMYHVIIPGLSGFVVTFGTSVYTPALLSITSHFGISWTAGILGLTQYTLGLAFGPVISAPLSGRFGRKLVYILSPPVFMFFILGAGFSRSFGSFLVCRLFAGLAGSPALAVATTGAGTTADLFPPAKRAKVTTFFLMAPFAGPSLGPVIGGFATQYKGWRWSQWCILFIFLTVYIGALPMKETYNKVILKHRAKKRGIIAPGPLGSAAVKKTVIQNFFRPVHMFLTEPVVFFLSLYTAFTFAILFLFFAAIPYVFERSPYSFTTSQTGLVFLAIGLGVLLAGITGILIDTNIYQAQHRKATAADQMHAQPEHWLYKAMIGSLGIPVGLFWFAWTANAGVHWAIPVVGAIPFAWGNLCLFFSSAMYMVDCYGPLNGASAIAGNGIFRYTLGAVFPLFTVQMYERIGIGWATSLLGFVSILMLPIPWVLFKYRPAIRKRSRYPAMMRLRARRTRRVRSLSRWMSGRGFRGLVITIYTVPLTS
ncbi:MFS general substrate transporter [Karstenula rhodostoma CBS 690.94]|uniref:MFS general substrate transporter n=1 Tax=Karstenula rhodostoma CBS 690.94 TaxID=1392251 RepID=A0A9P4U846_9PLEO|nr:MFS general substrate transporter [Karstenula rhodostoma CBS 690.94]